MAMEHGIKLTSEQWEEVDRLRMKTPSADVFRNCLIILKSSMRETIASIASQMGCGTDTVVRVRRLYRQQGVAGLQPAKPGGRTSRATPEFIARSSCAASAPTNRAFFGVRCCRTWPDR